MTQAKNRTRRKMFNVVLITELSDDLRIRNRVVSDDLHFHVVHSSYNTDGIIDMECWHSSCLPHTQGIFVQKPLC